MEATLVKRIWNYFRVKSAIKTANKLAQVSRKRHYVIKVFGKVRVYDRSHIDYLINEGLLSQRLRNAIELQKVCIYFTPNYKSTCTSSKPTLRKASTRKSSQ
jgi:hypothetical protein